MYKLLIMDVHNQGCI